MEEKIKGELMSHSRQVYNFCFHLTGNQIDADDLYQDTFLTAWEKRGRWDGLTLRDDTDVQVLDHEMRNYLFGIAAHNWRNRQRKIFRRNRIAPMDEREDALAEAASVEPGPESSVLQQEILRAVRQQVAALPDKFRIVVVMYYTGEMRTEEIALRLGIPAATVRSRLSKARKKIQKGLEGNGYEG